MKRILWIFFLLFAQLVPAGACVAAKRPCHQPWVYFGNGVWNTADDAERSKRFFAQLLGSHIGGTDLEGAITYSVSYNPSTGAIRDLLETFLQNFETDISQFWRFLAGLDPMPEISNNKFEIFTTV